MSDYTFRFLASQADDGIIYSSADSPNPLAPGSFAGWSSPSLKPSDSTALEELEADGGHWVGSVHVLSETVVNMTSSYFPKKGVSDNIQLAGPLMMAQPESAIAIVGGSGQYAGARGQATCVVVMSNVGTPIYHYELNFQA